MDGHSGGISTVDVNLLYYHTLTKMPCKEDPIPHCTSCDRLINQRDGYPTPNGDLLCDRCAWEWAESGEFL